MKEIVVSVIIPAFNRVDYLGKALESVRGQTFSAYEIIVVDDCSLEPIEPICRQYNCIYHRNNTSLGAQKSRNIGVSLAQGKYIAFLDSDDLWSDPNKLQQQFESLEISSASVLCFSRYCSINEAGNIIGTSLRVPIPSSAFQATPTLLKKDIIGTYSGVLIRKSAFDRVNGCDENLPARQDWDLWVRLSTQGSFYFLNQTLFQYRIHQNQISTDPSKKIHGTAQFLAKHASLFIENRLHIDLFIHELKLYFLLYISASNIKIPAPYYRASKLIGLALTAFVRMLLKIPRMRNVVVTSLNRTYFFRGAISLHRNSQKI